MFANNLSKLYAHVLEFQARVNHHLNTGSALRAARNVIKYEDWDKLIGQIKELESNCKEDLDALQPGELERKFKQLSDRMKILLDSQNEVLKELCHGFRIVNQGIEDLQQNQNDRVSTDEKERCLRAFSTSPYWEHKDRNPERLAGTCEWVITHENFLRWRENRVSGVLWINGIPGCGKSVLAKHLIENELPDTAIRTTCYFFFKDDVAEQKSVEHAFCALLHQLFKKKEHLLSHAIASWKADGDQLTRSFSKLWSIINLAAQDPSVGEVVCILDALDECEEYGQKRLIKALSRLQSVSLRFIVISRPYINIEKEIMAPTDRFPTIRLAGEDESHLIISETVLFVKTRLDKLCAENTLAQSNRKNIENALCHNFESKISSICLPFA